MLDFTKVENEQAAEALIKMAAWRMIEKEKSGERRKQLSLEYQVLSEETGIVGVLKQADKATGELQSSTIEFKKEVVQAPQEEEEEPSFYQAALMAQNQNLSYPVQPQNRQQFSYMQARQPPRQSYQPNIRSRARAASYSDNSD